MRLWFSKRWVTGMSLRTWKVSQKLLRSWKMSAAGSASMMQASYRLVPKISRHHRILTARYDRLCFQHLLTSSTTLESLPHTLTGGFTQASASSRSLLGKYVTRRSREHPISRAWSALILPIIFLCIYTTASKVDQICVGRA